MQDKVLKAQTRDERGKNESHRLRNSNFIPAVLYSHGKTENIKINANDFSSLFKGHISESVIFNLHIDGSTEEQLAFVKSVQRNPRTGKLIHLDLFKVTRGEKIHTTVPLSITGTAKGAKMGGLVEISKHEVDVECLPRDLPEVIEVDITELEINESILVKDIKVTDNITIKSNLDSVIVSVHTARVATAEELEAEEGETAAEEESQTSEASE